VSIQTAERQAGDRGVTLERELLILALHGFLHLLGFDHETDDGQMMALQSRLEAKYVTTPIGDAT
ncbi:MAG: rRNA maturation RNase YbeY, partial [Acidobacteriota bacterium]|nr:rRNA maturation RNase YbeY [Acidobacteriota bacterium]